MTDDEIKRLRDLADEYDEGDGGVLVAALRSAADEVDRLRAENFTLAAGACPHDDELVGDEYGNFVCRAVRERAEARRDALKEACALDAARTEGRREALEEAERVARNLALKLALKRKRGRSVLRVEAAAEYCASRIRALMDKELNR